jgi:hypothetical protein
VIEGVVVDFDDVRGDGTLRANEELFYFHCVAIADGSRTISVGARARGRRCVGYRGRDEVTAVEKV